VVFRLKLNTDRFVNCYKARHVAKGFTQQESIDYKKTIAPVARFTSLWVIISQL